MADETILDSNSPQLEQTVLDSESLTEQNPLSIKTFHDRQVVKEFAAMGAEADTYLLEDGTQQYFLKLYRKGVGVNEQVLQKITELSNTYPYFAKLIESGFDEDLQRFYEVSEYISSSDLENTTKEQLELRALIIALNEALKLLHDNNIIHRDLKPNNILIRQTAPLEIALIDFGISSVIREDMSKVLTSLKGTYAYTAPEVMSGYIGKEVDYWALGMIVLEHIGANPLPVLIMR